MTFFVIVAILALISLAVGAMAVALHRFNNKTEEICERLENTGNDTEYRLVKRELDCHYLTLIPFVNSKNSLKVYGFFYKGRHVREDKRSDTLGHILMPSILGIAICATCICTATWAWFSASQTNNVQQIKAAEYSLSVYVANDETGETVSSESGTGASFKLSAGSYTVKLTADKTANKGYGKVSDGNGEFVTDVIEKGSTLTFSYITSGDITLDFSSSWGVPEDSLVNLKEGDVIDRTTGDHSADTTKTSKAEKPAASVSSGSSATSGSDDKNADTSRESAASSAVSADDTASLEANGDKKSGGESMVASSLPGTESSKTTSEDDGENAPESAVLDSGESLNDEKESD